MARKIKKQMCKGERLISKIGIFLFLSFLVFSVFAQAMLAKVNVEVEKLNNEIKIQEDKNESLMMKINELASLENVKIVAAQMGLGYNNNNIKIIEG